MSKEIPTLSVRFSLPLSPERIPRWRGAVAEDAGWENDLFHNHAAKQVVPLEEERALHGQPQEAQLLTKEAPVKVTLKDSYLYRYPLIQYRVEGGKAAIFAIGEGVQTLREWLFRKSPEMRIGGKKRKVLIESMQEHIHPIHMLPHMRLYRLMDYQPFHSENYKKWQVAPDLTARIKLLENILAANILAFASSQNWRLEERLEVKLMLIRDTKSVKSHRIKRLAFNLIFKCNAALPPGISLGRALSYGFGVTQATRKQE